MQYLESDGSNLEIHSVTDRKPVEINKNRRNVAKARFLCNNPSKCVLDKLQASQNSKHTSQQGESYSSRVSNPLSRQLLSWKSQWWGKIGCDGVHECESKMHCMFRKPDAPRVFDFLKINSDAALLHSWFNWKREHDWKVSLGWDWNRGPPDPQPDALTHRATPYIRDMFVVVSKSIFIQ